MRLLNKLYYTIFKPKFIVSVGCAKCRLVISHAERYSHECYRDDLDRDVRI